MHAYVVFGHWPEVIVTWGIDADDSFLKVDEVDMVLLVCLVVEAWFVVLR